MPTEAARHRLYEKIKEQWGEQNADELMSYLPPVGWADVATKQDLDALRVATKQDLEALRVATKQDLEALRLELTLLDTKLSAKIDGLGANVDAKIDREIGSLRGELHKDSVSQLRWILTVFVGLTGVFALIVNWLG
jgi:hypothetical protein